jgi:hypothetical protein
MYLWKAFPRDLVEKNFNLGKNTPSFPVSGFGG